MSYIAVDLKVIEGRAAALARAGGCSEDRAMAGLVRLWHRVWVEQVDHFARGGIAGCFGTEGLDTLLEALVAIGFLEPVGDLYRVRGAGRYLRLLEGRRKGGLKASGNLIPGGPKAKKPTSAQPVSRAPELGSRAEVQPSPDLGSVWDLSPSTEHRAPNTEEKKLPPAPPALAVVPEPHFDAQEVQRLWNERKPPKAPTWRDMTPSRRKSVDARIREGLTERDWLEVIDACNASDFLSGRRSDFVANGPWCLKPENLAKIRDGNYRNTGPPTARNPKGPIEPTHNHAVGDLGFD